MRVIGGDFRSRRLKSIPGRDTRPTPDRLRETLFDILGSRIEGAVFLDAYAGTGAVGIEALSRGAARAIFIERSRKAARVILENLQSLGIENRGLVVTASGVSAMKTCEADVVFLDPPYERGNEYSLALSTLSERPKTLVIVQHSVRFVPAECYGLLRKTRALKQGDNALTFYSASD